MDSFDHENFALNVEDRRLAGFSDADLEALERANPAPSRPQDRRDERVS